MASITQISTATNLSTLNGTKVKSSSSSSSSSSGSSGTQTASEKADQLKNQFLGILLTQMQHQNPLDPMDTKEFTGQLAQFSSLEQQISTNVKLDSLLTSLQQSVVSSAFGYIGQYVDLNTPTSSYQDGGATWTYALPSDAESVSVTVKNAKGETVYSGALQSSTGSSRISAGTYSLSIGDSDLAKAVSDGEPLTMSIAAKDKSGKAITADIHTTVQVDSVQSDSTGTYLQAGGILFEIKDVQKLVTNPRPPTTTTTTATNDSSSGTTDSTDTTTDTTDTSTTTDTTNNA